MTRLALLHMTVTLFMLTSQQELTSTHIADDKTHEVPVSESSSPRPMRYANDFSEITSDQMKPATTLDQDNITSEHTSEGSTVSTPIEPGDMSVAVNNLSTEESMTTKDTGESEYVHPLVNISRKLFLVVIPIITIVGIVGNCLMLVVMQRPSQKESPVSVFMSALAVADTVVLVLDFINNWVNFVSSIHLKSSSVEFCRLYNFVFKTTFTYCAWLVVSLSIQRLVVVWFPLRAKSLCTVKKAIVTVCVLPVPCALLQSFNLFIWRIEGKGKCDLDDQYKYFNEHIQAWISAVFYSYLPVIILIISNTCLIGKLITAQIARKSMGAEKMEVMQVTQSVVVICVFFVILTVPLSLFYGIIYYLDQFVQRAPDIDLARTIILILGLSNHAINFFLYVLTSAKFRKELRYVCCCRNVAEDAITP